MSLQNFFKKKYFLYFIPLLILIVASKLMLKGSGDAHPTPRDITLVCFLYIILASSNKAYKFIGIPIAILYAIYTPIGLAFDKPTYQYIASVLATDAMESSEFFTQIPIINYAYSVTIIIGIILFKKLATKYDINYYKNKTLMIILVLIALINQSPFYYFDNIYQSIYKVKTELATFDKFNTKSEWGNSVVKNEKNYDDYILVIGESVRRDYMNIYGYPIENTPFVKSSKGTIINGLTSAGSNTIASLRLMLTLPDREKWEPNYGLSIVDLAKSANFETYWISNQGYVSGHDTPITFIAKRSDIKAFNKMSQFDSTDDSDFSLVPILKTKLNTPVSAKQKRLFIIHLYGSHPQVCKRIEDYKNSYETQDRKFKEISCYVSSIKKTDEVLGEIYSLLDQQYKNDKRTFSMVYFSDHGLSHIQHGDEIKMSHSASSGYMYNIPLIKWSSDDQEQKYFNTKKSGLMFVDGIAHWLGISNPRLNQNYDLFSNESDTEDFGLQKQIAEFNDRDDVVIDIRDK